MQTVNEIKANLLWLEQGHVGKEGNNMVFWYNDVFYKLTMMSSPNFHLI